MNKTKATAVIYHDWAPIIEGLSNEQVGELFRGIYDRWDGKEPSVSTEIRPIFNFIVMKIEENEKAYEEAKQKRIEGRRKQLENTSNELKSLQVTLSELKSLKPTVTVTVTDTVTGISKDILKEKDTKRKAASRFSPPTLEEVKAYCLERNNKVNPEQFVDFYSSKGWKIGSQTMKDWKAAVRTWEKREMFQTSQKRGSRTGADAGVTYIGNKQKEEQAAQDTKTDIFDLFGEGV